jgi:hypothetical protein
VNTFLFSLISLVPQGGSSALHAPIVLYIGPEQLLPFTSFFGAIVGFLLIFWSKLVNLFRLVKRLVSRD